MLWVVSSRLSNQYPRGKTIVVVVSLDDCLMWCAATKPIIPSSTPVRVFVSINSLEVLQEVLTGDGDPQSAEYGRVPGSELVVSEDATLVSYDPRCSSECLNQAQTNSKLTHSSCRRQGDVEPDRRFSNPPSQGAGCLFFSRSFFSGESGVQVARYKPCSNTILRSLGVILRRK